MKHALEEKQGLRVKGELGHIDNVESSPAVGSQIETRQRPSADPQRSRSIYKKSKDAQATAVTQEGVEASRSANKSREESFMTFEEMQIRTVIIPIRINVYLSGTM